MDTAMHDKEYLIWKITEGFAACMWVVDVMGPITSVSTRHIQAI